MNATPRCRRQAGLTLIELMIAMVLSLLLMAGTIALFGGTKQTYALQRAVSDVQASGHAALSLLEQQIRLAGHPEDSLALQSGIVGTKGKTYPVVGAHVFGETESADDALIVQFEAPTDGFRNCAGEVFNAGDVVAIRISLDAAGTLRCQGAAASADLATAVSGLTFTYGEDGADDDKAPDAYVTYDAVTNLRNVVAIRMSFAVGSDHPDVNPRQFTSTIAMRNQVH